MPQCVHIGFDENLHWWCNKLRKPIKDRDRCIAGPDALDCIEPIDPEKIDRAYDEIREEQKKDWQKLSWAKKTRLLLNLIEETKLWRKATKHFRDGKEDIGEYKMDVQKGMIWFQKTR
jgi:hypothetical protein